jgi:hypothetical protein
MRYLKLLLCIPAAYVVILVVSTPVTSCTKTKIVTDTTNIIVRDTVHITDTIVIK